MPSRAVQHHYLPQCYLRGFTRNYSKNSKITVIDFKRGTTFETIPRNVGGIRDFNRIDIPGQESDALEMALSGFESKLASHLSTFEDNPVFEGKSRDYILNLVALLTVRTPFMREQWRQFRAEIIEHVMDMQLSSKQRWESLNREMIKAGRQVNEKVTYEQIKEFHDRKEYTVEISTESHIHTEMKGMDAILPYLSYRNWQVLVASDQTGPFITTDNPVLLNWLNPKEIPPIYRYHPGFGLRGTQVLFPVSGKLLLVREFDGSNGTLPATHDLVAMLNTQLIMHAVNQIYAPRSRFYFMGAGRKLLTGMDAISYFNKDQANGGDCDEKRREPK